MLFLHFASFLSSHIILSLIISLILFGKNFLKLSVTQDFIFISRFDDFLNKHLKCQPYTKMLKDAVVINITLVIISKI